MKPIKLTEEHKKKLLEMCKKFFPEVVWQFWNDENCKDFDETHIGYSKTILLNEKKQSYKDGLIMHWFEFVMIHLSKKVISGYLETSTEDDDVNDFDNDYRFLTYGYLYPKMRKHPVDHLYERFKKLKL